MTTPREHPPSIIEERFVKSVVPPPWFPLTDEEFFLTRTTTEQQRTVPDTKRLHQFLAEGGKLSVEHVEKLISEATEIMKNEPNVLYLSGSFIVVGDLHGQYYDLNELLLREWGPSVESEKPSKWVFLGDYVDRGSFGLEIVLLLFAYKIRFPENIYLIRGNHEARTVTAKFNFKEECISKYSMSVYDSIMTAFDSLPLAAVLSTTTKIFFAVHGGISKDLTIVDDINTIDRFCEPSTTGLLCDLLWSDPLGEDTATGLDQNTMKEWLDVDYCENPTRGVGSVYGFKAVNYFLNDNGITAIIRSHEVAQAGVIENYMCQKKEDRSFPLVLTVFSAPNYCGWYNNQAAILVLNDDGSHQYKIFEETRAPFTLPAHLNGFTYTLPWITEQITKFMNIFFGMLIDQIEEKKVAEELREKLVRVKEINAKMEKVEKMYEAALQLKGLFVGGSTDYEHVKDINKGLLSVRDLDIQLDRYPSAPLTPRGCPTPRRKFWSKSTLELDPSVSQACKDMRHVSSHHGSGSKDDCLSTTLPPNWSVFVYEDPFAGGPLTLTLKSQGHGGLPELMEELRDDERAWAYYKKAVGDQISIRDQFVLICWMPDKVGGKKKAEANTHKPVIQSCLPSSLDVFAEEKKELMEKLS